MIKLAKEPLLWCVSCLLVLGVPFLVLLVPDSSSSSGSDTLNVPADSRAMVSPALLEPAVQVAVLRGDAAKLKNDDIPYSALTLEAMGAFRPVSLTSPHYQTAERCLAQAVYYEAALEPLAGQRAVAQVVLNRLRHPAYPDSVCGVVYEGWDRTVCQFSFVCDGSLRRTPVGRYWDQAQSVARAALDGYVEQTVGTATHYHADYVVPRWAFTLAKITKIGAHIFYRFPGRQGGQGAFLGSWAGREGIPNWGTLAAEEPDLQIGEIAETATVAATGLPRIATDRHADTDVGGRLDVNTGWRLDFPDPGDASAGYRQTLDNQVTAESETR